MMHTGMPRGNMDRAEDSPSAVTLWIARCARVRELERDGLEIGGVVMMTYEQAFRRAEKENARTGTRIKIYKMIWDGPYLPVSYILPRLPHDYAVLIGEVGRRTPR